MSVAFSFMAPMSLSTPSSFQLVATAPLTASGSSAVFPSFPDSRSNRTSMIAEKISTAITRSSIIRVTIMLSVYSRLFKNGINDYEFGRNILDVNKVFSNQWR